MWAYTEKITLINKEVLELQGVWKSIGVTGMNNFLSWKQVLSCRFKLGTKSHPFVTEHCDWTFFTRNWLYLSEMPIRRKRIFERVLNRPYYTLNFGQTRVLASRESFTLNIFSNIFFPSMQIKNCHCFSFWGQDTYL